jgi:HlyD family secretion protein
MAEQTWEKMKRGSRGEEIELAKARRDQASAQLSSLRKKVNDCVITSPLDGTVTKKFVERGELVGPGMTVVRISDLRQLTLTIYVSEEILPRIMLGQKASVKVDAYEERSFEGEIIFTSPTAEFTPKNIQTKDERIKLVFAVKLRIANPDGVLKGGVPADATLTLVGDEE